MKSLAWPLVAVSASLFVLNACGDDTSRSPQPMHVRGQAVTTGYDSCEGYCDAAAPSGCWCDELCAEYGDCCQDKAPVCDGVASSCAGSCGGKAPAGCWCDELCAEYGDCCEDKVSVCDAPAPSCVGYCGKKSPAGCWCNDLCVEYGDCCPDKQDVCDAPASADCKTDEDCASPGRCVGIPHDGSTELGRCVDTTHHPEGEGATCASDDACLAELVCAGDDVWGDGMCVPAWMAGTWTDTVAVPVPDGSSQGAARSVVVYGLATVPVDIVVDLSVSHMRPEDLRVTLTDPNGVEALVFEQGSQEGENVSGRFVVTGNPLDDMVNGRWTLRVADLVTGHEGTLESWTLSLTSRWD